ncbi:DNA polymerase III subunit gamma and tau [Intrasporangium calvum]|uniref:DNA polymerase III subunit gamma and tau n=1 Tax=Intrasporangium calvum TaxID=53358 RepID=UPI001F3F549B|nr:DNA polymerase III subunit gamma and tau [Intrasporangium calvum]
MATALYRRYRPESFAEVIGQEHVTEPLMQALRTDRVGHAYLFSGPRGCGKTTSARILARCLNCEEGPTPTPCGVCQSCVALARGGPGSVDVIEIDAASHGGVDDARDLRERASYGPAQSRFKIYIIDEAHMVTPQGFNALLKIVEEPPEHVKFVFATTEPEKVIGTIRSRTHHYPFRLVPPAKLSGYMESLLEQERVAVAPGVLSFVVRAGGGSVRDSLSVLDQLIAGSGPEGLTYESAVSLLGFTDGELLDATVDALAAADGAATFRQIDRVIESGLDPRRFIEDLLERLRDLIIVAAVPEAGQVLRGVPEDQLERMRVQQAAFGPGALSRAADIANSGLTEMTGATAPRMQLELICARILLPASSGEAGYGARLDRLERRLEVGGVPSQASSPEHQPSRMPLGSPPPVPRSQRRSLPRRVCRTCRRRPRPCVRRVCRTCRPRRRRVRRTCRPQAQTEPRPGAAVVDRWSAGTAPGPRRPGTRVRPGRGWGHGHRRDPPRLARRARSHLLPPPHHVDVRLPACPGHRI